MECYSCNNIAKFYFVVNGRIDLPPESKFNYLQMCCRDDLKYDIDGSFMNFPSISLSDTPEDTLENFFKMRADTIAKGIKGGVINLRVNIVKSGLKPIGNLIPS